MASDLIFREDAKDYVRHAFAKGLNVLEYLDEVPAANFRPVVRGKWEDCTEHNGEVYDEHGIRLGIANWAKAVPVPKPHGRLIDADEIKGSIRKQTAFLRLLGEEFAEMAEMLEKGFLQEIDNATTIIPAEPEEEETK